MTDYYVAFWNVENLYDINNSPRRSDKLQRTIGNELTGWTTQLLNRKIAQLSSLIVQMNNGNGPDLLGVCEVENDHVLNLLVNALSGLGRNYHIVHDDMSDRRGIDVAFIYDADVFTAGAQFSHTILKRSATRDLFQVNFTTAENNTLVAIGNHWPSRSGGQYESEPYRMMAAETLAYFHERIKAVHGDDVAVLAMGDFNDEPFNRSLTNYARAERLRAKVTRGRSAKFLNLMWDFVGEGQGTHYFSNQPNVLDHFLASKGLLTGSSGLTLDANSVTIERFPAHNSGGTYPTPVRFGRGSDPNRDGFSDHYPISVIVSE